MREDKFKKGLIIIPARGGSKRIKNKNIVSVYGKPLIFYTISVALKAKENILVDRVIVSTDNKKIARISAKLGAEVPFLRPKNISGDRAKSIDFVIHAIDFYERKNIFYDYIVLLQPTSPLRKYEDVEKAIKLFINNNNNSLISVYQEKTIDETELYYKSKNLGIPLSVNHNKGTRKQDLKTLFIRNAAIYITSVKYLKKSKKIISAKPLLFKMPKDRSLDIDTKEDLKKLNNTLRQGKNV